MAELDLLLNKYVGNFLQFFGQDPHPSNILYGENGNFRFGDIFFIASVNISVNDFIIALQMQSFFFLFFSL